MAGLAGADSLVNLSRMQQLAEARSQDDDWTGLKSRAERRKRQNRLNVRAHRRRKHQHEDVSDTSSSLLMILAPQNHKGQLGWELPYGDLEPARRYISPYSLPPAAGQASTNPTSAGPVVSTPDFNPLSLNGNIIMPLSIDCLIPMVRYNVYRATMTNISILSLHDKIAPKRDQSTCPHLGPLFPAPEVVPASLAPTPLQLSTPHELWIDMLPHGTMRDNAIRMRHTFDNDDFCHDLMCTDSQGQDPVELKGVVVWNDPWCVSGWEVTEGFLKKWGFLVKDCWEIMAATNKWREKRGDEPLVFDL